MQQNQDPRNPQDRSNNQPENDPVQEHIMDENHQITDEDIRNHQPEDQRHITMADVTSTDEEIEKGENKKDGDENDVVTPWDVVNPTL